MQIKCIMAAQLCQNDGLRSVMDLKTNSLCWSSRSRRRYNQYPLTIISLSKFDLDLNTSISLQSLQSKRIEASMLLSNKPQPPPSLSLNQSIMPLCGPDLSKP